MRLFMAAALVFYFSNLDWNVQPNIFPEERQVSVPLAEPAIADIAADEQAAEQAPTSGESPVVNSASAPDADRLDIIPEASMEEVCSKLAAAAQEAEIPLPFLARLIWQESRFRSRAISPVGAQGMAQFMPATAAEEGLDDPFDPLKAIQAAAGFLRKLHRQFGNLGLAAAAYNAGGGRIRQWLARRGPLPQETQDYVRMVTGNSADDWAAPARTVAMTLQLPKQAPCEGVGGLSRARSAALIPVSLSVEAGDIVRKAEAEARAAAAAKTKAKLLMARAQMGRRNGKAKSLIAGHDTKSAKGVLKTAILPHTKPGKPAPVRLASAR
jgi:hypothetical protein